jgi:hypothetical protein
MTSSLVIRTDLSGSSFVLDVSALELSSSLSLLDFEVTHNGIVNSSYTKTSATQLTYSGTSVTLGTKVIARRTTPLTTAESTFISTTTAASLTNALVKLQQRTEELDARLSYALNQLSVGGISLGAIPVSNVAFGAGWSGDTTTAPSKNATYNAIIPKADTTSVNAALALKADAAAVTSSLALKADLASPSLTGTPTTPTQVVADSSTRIANTAFVKSSVLVNTTTAADVNITGNNVNVTVVSLTSALGSNVYRFVLVRVNSRVLSGGKSNALYVCELLNTGSSVVETNVIPIFGSSFLDQNTSSFSKVLTGTFTGNYTFTVRSKLSAQVATDVYSVTGNSLELVFIA